MSILRPGSYLRVTVSRSLALAFALAAFPLGTRAQGTSTREPQQTAAESLATAPRLNLILVNPFGVVFNIFNGEYEHVMSRSASVGLAATYYSPQRYTYLTGEVKARYYPSEHAPDGFSVALSGGVTHETTPHFCYAGNDGSNGCPGASSDRPTLGFELDYNWLLGPARHFTIGAGIGAKRFFGTKTYDSIDGLPTARLALGVAF